MENICSRNEEGTYCKCHGRSDTHQLIETLLKEPLLVGLLVLVCLYMQMVTVAMLKQPAALHPTITGTLQLLGGVLFCLFR
jgi:hypothetical protein